MATPRLGFAVWPSGIQQADVPANDNVRRLDATVNLAVVSMSLAAQPTSPTNGDTYVLPASATGAAWAGQTEGTIAHFDTNWAFYAPIPGMVAQVLNAGAPFWIRYQLGAWVLESDALLPPAVSQVEAEEGTETALRLWTPLRVAQAVAALSTKQPASVTQAEAEAGTVTAARTWSPERVAQAIAALGSGGELPWSVVTADQTLVPNEAVIADTPEADLILTIPASPAVGDVFRINAKGIGNHIVAPNGNAVDGFTLGDPILLSQDTTTTFVVYDANTLRIV